MTSNTMDIGSPMKTKSKLTCELRDLITATCNGWNDSVTELSKNGVNMNLKNKNGITALHVAAIMGNNTMVKTLINCGADVNCREDNCMSTPLHCAVIKGKVVSVQNVIELNREISSRGCGFVGEVMLTNEHYSAKNYESVILTLLKRGADLNAKDKYGKTPLHLAVYYRSDSVKVLLGLGADVDEQDNAGHLPWHYAVDNNNLEGLRWLLAFGADINDVNMLCLADVEKLKSTLAWNVNMNCLIIDQLTRLRAARLFISRMYETPAFNVNSSENFYRKCLHEVRKMEMRKIEDGVTVYNLLHMEPRQKLAYTRDSEKMKNMLIEFESEFPNYYGIIRAKFLEERKRKPLINAAKSAWYDLTNIGLPDICVERILSYLNAYHLKVLIVGANRCEAIASN